MICTGCFWEDYQPLSSLEQLCIPVSSLSDTAKETASFGRVWWGNWRLATRSSRAICRQVGY